MSDFYEAVVKMRGLQIDHERVKSQSSLTAKRESEEEVDRLIREERMRRDLMRPHKRSDHFEAVLEDVKRRREASTSKPLETLP